MDKELRKRFERQVRVPAGLRFLLPDCPHGVKVTVTLYVAD
jgi:hypothetical protein